LVFQSSPSAVTRLTAITDFPKVFISTATLSLNRRVRQELSAVCRNDRIMAICQFLQAVVGHSEQFPNFYLRRRDSSRRFMDCLYPEDRTCMFLIYWVNCQ